MPTHCTHGILQPHKPVLFYPLSEQQGFTDRAFAREELEEYLRLRIKCSNSIYGCLWEGQLRFLKVII